MTPSEELALLEQEAALDWCSVEPGLRPGADDVVDARLTLHAPRLLRDLQQQAPPAHAAAGGLSDLSLDLRIPPGIRVQMLSRLPGDGERTWALPDLRWHQAISVALRFHVSAAARHEVNSMRLLAQARLTATAALVDGADDADAGTLMLRLRMGLPVLSDAEREAIGPDEQTRHEVERLRDQPAVPWPPGAAGDPRPAGDQR